MAVQLYEITAMISRSVVVAATSEADAKAHIESWEQAWERNSDFIGVSDVEVFDVRKANPETLDDEAHEVTDEARKELASITPPNENEPRA